MTILATHWLWLLAGAALMLAEIVLPGFVVMFFGMGAAVTGIAIAVAGEGSIPAWGQLTLFCAFSVASLVGFRSSLKNMLGIKDAASDADRAEIDDSFRGRTAVTVTPVSPGAPGRVMLGDAEWSCTAKEPLEAGRRVTVVSRKNLTLEVKPLDGSKGE